VLVVDGYVRPSGPTRYAAREAAVQRWQIEHWAAARGWRLGHVFEEAATREAATSMPRLGEALDRIESRESDGIVVARLNQVGESLGEVLGRLERIEAAGGTFASVGDAIDLSTPTGRLMLRLLLCVSDWWPS
jgi:DNA invertase Pin-like site-specific DNA recombinase